MCVSRATGVPAISSTTHTGPTMLAGGCPARSEVPVQPTNSSARATANVPAETALRRIGVGLPPHRHVPPTHMETGFASPRRIRRHDRPAETRRGTVTDANQPPALHGGPDSLTKHGYCT